MRDLWAVCTGALVFGAAYGYGAWALAACGVVCDGPERRLLFRLGLGLGVIGLIVLALGLPGWLGLPAGWAVVGLGLLAAGASVRRERPASRAAKVGFPRREIFPHVLPGDGCPVTWRWTVWVVLAVSAWCGLCVALAPPAGYDELTYHLAAPKVYARTGLVRVLPYDHHTAFSFGLQMLYTLGLVIGNAGTAKLVHLGCWALSLLALFVGGRDYLGRRAAWLALLVCAATPVLQTHIGLAYTEFGVALYSLLALLAFLEYLNLRATALTSQGGALAPQARAPRWLTVCAVSCGLAVGVKTTAGLLGAYLLGALVVLGWRDRAAWRRDALVFVVVATLVAAPWPLRAWAATGNPVFPFAHGLFGSPVWSADRAACYDEAQKEFGRALDARLQPTEPPGAHRRLARLLTVPWNATFQPSWYYDRGLNTDGKARLGPAYLALGLPCAALWLVLLVQRRRRPWGPRFVELREEGESEVYAPEFGREVPVARVRAITEQVTLDTPLVVGLLLGWVLLFGLFWFVSMQYLRYFAPMLTCCALLAGWAADGLLRLRLSAVATVLILAMQVVGALAYAVTGGSAAQRVLLGRLDRDTYAAAADPAYGAMRWLNSQPDVRRTVLYGEPRGYWLDGPYLWGERNHHTLIPDSARTSPEAYLAALRGLGVTHALVNTRIFPLGRLEPLDDVALVSRLILSGELVRVWSDPDPRRAIEVFALR